MDTVLEHETHEVEERHWWYGGRRRAIAAVLDRADLPPGARILDAGCGSGRNMELLARYGVVRGLELSTPSVEVARARGVGEVEEGSLEEPLPFGEASFDLAVALDVLEHLDDDAAALRELRRVVRDGGLLLVTVPAHPALWGDHDELSHHRRRYTRRGLLSGARAAGWEPVLVSGFNALLLPAVAAARIARRARRPGRAPRSDLERTPRALNAVLELPLRAEARVLAAGGRLPTGVSLLALLRADGRTA